MALLRTTTSPYEPIFSRFSGAIPQAYLRTLAYRESSFNPTAVHPASNATGLFQITQIALKGFNQARGSRLSLAHLKDPTLNTQVAAHHLSTVLQAYRRVRALAPDWTSRRWLELLTLGWNAGHNAIIGVASKMEKAGFPPERINVDTVSQVARSTGQGKYIADPGRVAWSKSVAGMFLGGGAVPARPQAVLASMLPSTAGGSLAIIGAVVVAGTAIAFGTKGQS